MKTNRLTDEDIAEIFEEFYLLRDAEIDEKEALEILLENQPKKAGQHFLNGLLKAPCFIEGLSEFPQLIPEYIIALLKQAKQQNAEIEALKKTSEHLSKLLLSHNDIPYKKMLKNSLFYPCITFAITMLICVFSVIFIFPPFEELFKSFGADLPALTRQFILLSYFISSWYWLLIILILAIFIYFKLPISLPLRSKIMLRFPTIRYIEAFVCLRTLYLLLTQNIKLAEALRLSATASKNRIIINALLAASTATNEGKSFVESLASHKVFSKKTLRLLTIFEKTNRLSVLDNLSKQTHSYVKQCVKVSSRTMSLFLLLFVSILVGLMIIAMYLPIFMLGSSVS